MGTGLWKSWWVEGESATSCVAPIFWHWAGLGWPGWWTKWGLRIRIQQGKLGSHAPKLCQTQYLSRKSDTNKYILLFSYCWEFLHFSETFLSGLYELINCWAMKIRSDVHLIEGKLMRYGGSNGRRGGEDVSAMHILSSHHKCFPLPLTPSPQICDHCQNLYLPSHPLPFFHLLTIIGWPNKCWNWWLRLR